MVNILVIGPVERLKRGMDSMAAADFGVRLAVESNDEFGELAAGFNRMADRLRGVYDTLEHRVVEKTHDIEEKARELAVLYEIAAYLAEPAEIDTVCSGILEKLRLLLDAEAGTVRLADTKSELLDLVATSNISSGFIERGARLPVGSCLCGQATNGGALVTGNLTGVNGAPLNCARENMSSMVVVPIRSKNQIFGVFNLFFRNSRQLAQSETQLLEAVGQQLGVAIENRRLVLREKEMAVSEERNLLAQELHDSIAQSLAFLNIQAQMLQSSLRSGAIEPATLELARMREGIQECYDNVRELLVHFRIRLGSADIDVSIRNALEKFEGQTGIGTSFLSRSEAPIPATVSAIQVLHIVQEALSNIRKHAMASKVSIEMNCSKDLVISVRDDGCGFDPSALDVESDAHVGIVIMRERAHRIGAYLELESSPGAGTCVTLRLPTATKHTTA